ncbi:hypothetical protein [Nocardia amamiensis]|uniref:hypothetical protein n=1 Tax=Nocardia amamiensis TaxID=404578 RepID=UPI000832D135|nr:hypothetical protein [Nocardia amamiensis]
MTFLPHRKPITPTPPVALGYIHTAHLAPDTKLARLGAWMRARAERWGYLWGGTHLDLATHGGTVAALTRHATRDPDVWLIVVPDNDHLPHGERVLTTSAAFVRIVTADSDDGATICPPTPIPARP